MLTFLDEKMLESAKQAIELGEIVAFPTETVYGIAVDAKNSQAISNLYKLKGRDFNKPMQIMLSDFEEAEKHVEFSEKSAKIAQKFWPGALTIILPKKHGSNINKKLCGENNSLGVRVPDHQITRKIIEYIGMPLATTSANYSGEKSFSNSLEIKENMGGDIAVIFEGEANISGVASTIIDMVDDRLKILREGDVLVEDIKNLI